MAKKFLGSLAILACSVAATFSEKGIAETLTPRPVARPGPVAPIPQTGITNTTGASPKGKVQARWTPRNYSSGPDLSGAVTGSNASNAKTPVQLQKGKYRP